MSRNLHSSLGVTDAVVCAVILGAASAFGDWLWTRYIPDGAIVPGVVHGVLIFLLLAIMLAWAAGSRTAFKRLVPTLPLAGLAIAAAFYPIARTVGYIGGLMATWILMWLSLALLQRWARGGTETWQRALLRGLLAAIASGLAFWTISGIWTNPSPTPNYLLRFVYWSYAFLPGFVALLWRQVTADSTLPNG